MKSMKTLRAAVLHVVLAATSPFAMAGNTWDGGGADDNWESAANWSPDGAPGYGTLSFSGSVRTTNQIVNTWNMNQLNWNGASNWTLNSDNTTHILNLFDFGGTQAKLEALGTGSVTINAPVTFAATTGAAWGEINPVVGDMTFSGGNLNVSGSIVAGIKTFGSGHVLTYNNTVNAAGKWFATCSANGVTMNIGGAFTSGDIYVMNDSSLRLNAGGSITNNAIRLGGDFGTTLTQNLAKSASFSLTSATGGQTYGGVVNSVSGNTSGTLAVNSQNTSGTNTLSGHLALDSNLSVSQSAGGTLNITQVRVSPTDTVTGTDIKGQTLTLNSNGTINISGNIYNSTGNGNIVKSGTGVVNLSNANTYSGSTSVNAGTLLLSKAAALYNNTPASWIKTKIIANSGSTLALNVGGTNEFTTANVSTLLANLTVDVSTGGLKGGSTFALDTTNTTGGNFIVADVIANTTGTGGGTLALTKLGANTLTLSGNNTYTGATTITAGTLQIGTGGSSGAVAGNITNNAALVFNRSDSPTYSGAVTGSGSLTQNGTGTLILTGTSSYSGGTTISNGTLQIGSGGTVGSISGNVTNNASLVFNRSDSTTFAGAISGGGSVTQAGAATLTLIGNSTYTGTTHINSGTLQVGDGTTNGSLNSALINNNTSLTFNVVGTQTFSGAIAGAGNFTKTSAGALTLSGTNLYTGATNVNAGTLVVSGTHNANHGTYSVQSGAQLRITGLVSTSGTPAPLTGGGITDVDGGNAVFSNVSINQLTVQNNGKVTLAAASPTPITAVNKVAALNLTTGGQLDITNNALQVQSADTTDASRDATWAKVLLGQNNFDVNGQITWDGPGIVSTSARTTNLGIGVDAMTVGVVSNHDLARLAADGGAAIPYDAGNPWLGTISTIGADDILVRMTYAGDTNLDGTITIDDYNNIDSTFSGVLPTNYGWVSGDFDFSGAITIDDYNAIDAGFLYQGGQLTQGMLAQRQAMFGSQYVAHLEQLAAAFASVPEPTTAGVLAIGAMGILARRRKCSGKPHSAK